MATIYKEGSRGAVVAQIQKIVGAYPDGFWGTITTECVKKWQAAHKLTSDGLAGPATLAKMGIAAVTPSGGGETKIIKHGDIELKRSKRKITSIVVHCTATPEGNKKTVAQLRAEHKRKGWSDIGYHYVVTLDGKVHIGRDVDVAGAHVEGHNAHSIGVVYVGGLENIKGVAYAKLPAKDTRTDEQKAALLSLLMDLRKLYPDAKICGHRDFSPDKNGNGTIEPNEWIKSCPSFDAKKEYSKI